MENNEEHDICKTVSAGAMSMCGKIVPQKYRTSKWPNTTCKECLKFMPNKSKFRMERENKLKEKRK